RSRDMHQERRYLQDRQNQEEQHRIAIEQQRAAGQNADHQLDRRAQAMLDARYDQARETLARKPQILEKMSAAQVDADSRRARRLEQGAGHEPDDRELAAYERAASLEGELRSSERFVHGAQEHERLTGQRYTPRQLQEARSALELELGTHPAH